MSESEYQRLRADPEEQAALFKRLVLERVREWAEFAAGKLKGTEIPAGDRCPATTTSRKSTRS